MWLLVCQGKGQLSLILLTMGLLEKALGGTLLLHTDDRTCGDNRISVNVNRSALKMRGDTNRWIVLNLIHSLHILLVRMRNNGLLL